MPYTKATKKSEKLNLKNFVRRPKPIHLRRRGELLERSRSCRRPWAGDCGSGFVPGKSAEEKWHRALQKFFPQICQYPPGGDGGAGWFVLVIAGELVA
jgi:hypothetical protein